MYETNDINALIEGAKRYESAPVHIAPEWEFGGQERDFTVTVSGSERHNGENGYTYVLRARSMREAWGLALSHHIITQEDIDSYVDPDPRMTFEGAPAEDVTYFFNDLRPGTAEDAGVPLHERN